MENLVGIEVAFCWCLLLTAARALSCEDVLNSPNGAASLPPGDLSSLGGAQVELCLAELGKQQLTQPQAEALWTTLIEEYGDAGAVPMDTLKLLGYISTGIPPSHYQNMSLNDIDVIESFGKFHDLSDEQLLALAERVRDDWAGKEPEDYSQYDLQALGHILCAFNKTDIEKIHPKAYKEAALELSNLQNCPLGVLQGFANLAVDPTAFGPPASWSKSQLFTVGIIRTGLSTEDLKSIPTDA